MGTNFYLRKKIEKYQRAEIDKALDNGDYDKVRELLPKDIHIGKRSYGWKFLWDAHYLEYFEPTKESLFEWLKSGQIIDEYGEEFTFDQFINEELKGFIDEGDDAESVEREYGRFAWCDSQELIKDFNRRCEYKLQINAYGEFYIDNLRFTTSEDFC